MKDKWLNTGYEENMLRPFVEPVLCISDEKRINCLVITVKFHNHYLNEKFSFQSNISD